jgi:hypothetical protein
MDSSKLTPEQEADLRERFEEVSWKYSNLNLNVQFNIVQEVVVVSYGIFCYFTSCHSLDQFCTHFTVIYSS